MQQEPATDTLTAPVTLTEAWLDEQHNRLIGYECLMRMVTADPTPMSPGEMSDRIGLNKGYAHKVLSDVINRING